MADEDYGEDDAFFFDDDDYLYVEDDYAIAVSPSHTRQLASRPYIRLAHADLKPGCQRSGSCMSHTRAPQKAVTRKDRCIQ